MTPPIRVSVVEDRREYRNTLTALLKGAPGFQLVSADTTAEDALRNIPAAKPDVVLVDLKLPGMSGVELIRQLRADHEKLPLMVLTAFADDDLIFDSLKAGASGYLLKRTPLPKLCEAIEELHHGGSPMTPEIARKVTNYFRSLPQPSPEADTLTRREREILEHLAKGSRSKEIADNLDVSTDTVHTHLRHLYEKLHVHSAAAAVAKHLRR